jgi:hypothetical protein
MNPSKEFNGTLFLFEKVIAQIKRHVHSLTFYFQGEPYLNPVNFPNTLLKIILVGN